MSAGWQCPGCSRCYSPSVAQCFACGDPGAVSTGAGTVPCAHSFTETFAGGYRCLGCRTLLLPRFDGLRAFTFTVAPTS